MKVLVIGHCGFIGRSLADLLSQEGFDVVGLDVRPPKHATSYPSLIGSVSSKDDIRRAAEGRELIINLAAEHRDFGITRESYFAVNEQGTQNVVETASELGIDRVFFFSSVAVYGPGTHLTEDAPRTPSSVYGESKVAGENRVLAWAAAGAQRQVKILRPTVVFGPRNFGNMFNLIKTIAAGRFVMVGTGENIKSVAYVDNVVAATMFLLRRMQPGVAIYNYSDVPQMTAIDLVKVVSSALGRKPPRLRLPLAPVIAIARLTDLAGRLTGYDFPVTANRIRKLNISTTIISDRIRNEGFHQTTSIEDGIRRTVEWYREYQVRASH